MKKIMLCCVALCVSLAIKCLDKESPDSQAEFLCEMLKIGSAYIETCEDPDKLFADLKEIGENKEIAAGYIAEHEVFLKNGSEAVLAGEYEKACNDRNKHKSKLENAEKNIVRIENALYHIVDDVEQIDAFLRLQDEYEKARNEKAKLWFDQVKFKENVWTTEANLKTDESKRLITQRGIANLALAVEALEAKEKKIESRIGEHTENIKGD